MEENIGFKELYDVTLKTTFPFTARGRNFELGETVAVFDRIRIANFEEKRSLFTANGGYDNRAHVWWEETKEVKVNLTQGVFSRSQFCVMANGKMIDSSGDENPITISRREIVETDEAAQATLSKEPNGSIFIYNQSTGERITNFSIAGRELTLERPYQMLIVDYTYDYEDHYTSVTIGQELTRGYLSLEGKMRVKDDETGRVTTGVLKIPKLKLLSGLSMRMGQDAVPVLGRLDAVAVPVGERGKKKVMELYFLDEHIDSDI